MTSKFIYTEENFLAYPRSFLRDKVYTPKDFGKVAVLLGGESGEREVSLESGSAVLQALRNRNIDAHPIDAVGNYIQQLIEGNYDRAFIILHGKIGEDGCVQGALEAIKLPYTGSGVAASALAMDKARSKMVFHSLGIPTLGFTVAYHLKQAQQAVAKLGFPVAVKPVAEGSSLGTYCVMSDDALESAFTDARQYGPVLIEPWVTGKDVFVTVLGDEVFPSVEVQTASQFYDYEAKYKSDQTQYFCPGKLTDELEQKVRELAKKAFYALGCTGWGRIDFMIDQQHNPWVLEVNTIPGMTSHSLVPMSAKEAGLSFDDLVMCILATSLKEQDRAEAQEAKVAAR